MKRKVKKCQLNYTSHKLPFAGPRPRWPDGPEFVEESEVDKKEWLFGLFCGLVGIIIGFLGALVIEHFLSR